MGIIVDFIRAVANLIEAEGRALRSGLIRLVIAVALTVLSLAFVLAGFVLVVWGVYLWLATLTAPVWAAFLAGAASLLLGGALILEAKVMTR